MAIDFEMTGINSDSPQYFDDLPFERYEKVFYFLLKFFFTLIIISNLFLSSPSKQLNNTE